MVCSSVYVNNNDVLDGFAIVIGKTKNYLGAGGSGLGYDGIYNSLVAEVDLNQDEGDKSSNTISYHDCIQKTCSWQEGPGTIQTNLSLKYNKCKTFYYDIYIKYHDKSLYIENNGSTISTSVDLLKNFDGYGYIGFTASQKGFSRKIIISDASYFCFDKIDSVYFDVFIGKNTYINNFIPNDIPAGSTIELHARFIDIEKLAVPHLNKLNVTNWKLTIGYNCITSVYNWKHFIFLDKVTINNIVII